MTRATVRPLCPAHRRFSQQKCCIMHESPVRRAAPQHPEVDVNGSNGPFMLVGARSFGRIAAMRRTAARRPRADVRNLALTGGLQ